MCAGLVSGACMTLALGSGSSDAAETSPCAAYATLSVEALASGAQVLQKLANATVVNDVDAGGPAAQARVDSITGSSGRAGTPFSSTIAENGAFFGFNPNDVPVFALSSYPLQPEASQSSPAHTLHATSAQFRSSARAEVGLPASSAGAAANARVASTSECTETGSLHAVADTATESISIADVLTIGSVRSHAEVTIDPGEEPVVDATISFDGVAVLGQPVGLSQEGLVIGPTVVPLPANPLAEALEAAGVTVRYLEAVEDAATGTALAPGVEITVTYLVPGIGTGPLSTSLTVGQAYARISNTAVPAVEPPATPGTPPAVAAPTVAIPPIPPASMPRAPSQPVAPSPESEPTDSSLLRIADWSIAAAYYALALGALLSIGLRAVIRRTFARYRWT